MYSFIKDLCKTIKTSEINVEDNIGLDESLYNDKYKETVMKINKTMDTSIFSEIITNMNDMCRDCKGGVENTSEVVHSFSINPEIHLIDKTNLLNIADFIRNKNPKTDDDISFCICDIIGETPKCIEDNNFIIKKWFNFSDKCIVNNLDRLYVTNKLWKISENVCIIRDNIDYIKNILIDELQKCKNTFEFDMIFKISECITELYRKYVAVYCISFAEWISIIKYEDRIAMNESTSQEDVLKYVDELYKLIKEIRGFYDKFKYKEIIVPRKKKIDKMNEYMLGALDRKYTLRIPIYKVVGASEKVKNIVENEFIAKLDSIVNKYPNYILMTPDYSDDSDMYIYITLKEPFGDKDDRGDRVEQSKNSAVVSEAALTADDRTNLKDSDFGLPELRLYPLIDKIHIIKAIQFFGSCKPENKKELASNIVKKIIEQDLVGTITISKNNKFKEYFPEWLKSSKSALSKNGDKYNIYIDGDLVYTGALEESVSSSNLEFYI